MSLSAEGRPSSGEVSSGTSPVTSLDDPRALQILSTEHWSLLTARSLAYNEAFTRGGMYLAFLSTSFVALALISQAMSFQENFLVISAIVLGFDAIIGITTYARIIGANTDDLRALHGMARIRHGYTQIAPIVAPYFTTGTTDDLRGVMLSYGTPPSSGLGLLLYGMSTSGGMIGLINSLVVGVLAGVIVLLFHLPGEWAVGIGVVAAIAAFIVVFTTTRGYIERHADLTSLFPSPPES